MSIQQSVPILRHGDVEHHLSKLLRSFAFQPNICCNTHGHVSVFSKALPVCLVRSYRCGYVAAGAPDHLCSSAADSGADC